MCIVITVDRATITGYKFITVAASVRTKFNVITCAPIRKSEENGTVLHRSQCRLTPSQTVERYTFTVRSMHDQSGGGSCMPRLSADNF